MTLIGASINSTRHDTRQKTQPTQEPERPESLSSAAIRFGLYWAAGVSWYVKPIPGPLAKPLDIKRRAEQAYPASPPQALAPFTNRKWLNEKPFRLVLGAGFVGGLYRHLGLLRALEDVALRPRDVVGVSAGAIIGVMYGALPLRGKNSVEHNLMTLHPQDFLDPCWATLVQHGAICPGHAFERKLERTFAPSKKTDLIETSPRVAVEIYDTHTGSTSLLDHGNMVQAVRWSASLPVLFAGGRFIDGGVVDQNGLLGMVPGERCINHTIFDGDDRRDFIDWRIGRPKAVFSPSNDAEHRTLHFVGPEKITKSNFIFALQDEEKLRRVTAYAEEAAKQWLSQPA